MNKLLIIFARIIVLRWQPINNPNDRQMCKRNIWLLQLYRLTIQHYAYFMRQTPSKQKMKTDDNEKKMLRQTSVIAFQVHGFINHHHLKCIDSFGWFVGEMTCFCAFRIHKIYDIWFEQIRRYFFICKTIMHCTFHQRNTTRYV